MFPSFHEFLHSNTGPLVPWGPVVSQWPHHFTRSCTVTMVSVVPQGPAVSQCPLGSMRPQSANGLLGGAESQWSPGYTRSCSVTSGPWFHGAPQCHSCSLVPWVPTVSQCPHSYTRSCSVTVVPWFHWAPGSHKGLLGSAGSQWLLGSTRPHSVTVASVVPRGPRLSQWTPWFHLVPQCHNGPLVLWCLQHAVSLWSS